jgi:hypothetical protein
LKPSFQAVLVEAEAERVRQVRQAQELLEVLAVVLDIPDPQAIPAPSVQQGPQELPAPQVPHKQALQATAEAPQALPAQRGLGELPEVQPGRQALLAILDLQDRLAWLARLGPRDQRVLRERMVKLVWLDKLAPQAGPVLRAILAPLVPKDLPAHLDQLAPLVRKVVQDPPDYRGLVILGSQDQQALVEALDRVALAVPPEPTVK